MIAVRCITLAWSLQADILPG